MNLGSLGLKRRREPAAWSCTACKRQFCLPAGRALPGQNPHSRSGGAGGGGAARALACRRGSPRRARRSSRGQPVEIRNGPSVRPLFLRDPPRDLAFEGCTHLHLSRNPMVADRVTAGQPCKFSDLIKYLSLGSTYGIHVLI